MQYFLSLILFALCFSSVQGQSAADRLQAFAAVKEMKENGVLLVRLDSKDTKIKVYERALADSKLNDKKRRRLQGELDATIKRRDIINTAIAQSFSDSFDFCPVFICFDTSSNTLKAGLKKGIFFNRDISPAPDISIPDSAAIFVVYFHEKSGQYPTDGLILRRLRGILEEPFPKYTAIRESFINDINSPRISRAAAGMNRRLHRLYERALKKEED